MPPSRARYPPRAGPVGPPLPAAPHDLQARRVADHHPEILAPGPARHPEPPVPRPVDQHHPDIPAGGGGPLPRPHRLRGQPVHLRSGASPYRPVRDAAAGSPTARIQPVPLTCSAACTVLTSPPEGVVEQIIPFSSHSARGATPCTESPPEANPGASHGIWRGGWRSPAPTRAGTRRRGTPGHGGAGAAEGGATSATAARTAGSAPAAGG